MQSNVCMCMFLQTDHLMPFQLCMQSRMCQKKFCPTKHLNFFVCVRFLSSKSDNKNFYHFDQKNSNLNRALLSSLPTKFGWSHPQAMTVKARNGPEALHSPRISLRCAAMAAAQERARERGGRGG